MFSCPDSVVRSLEGTLWASERCVCPDYGHIIGSGVTTWGKCPWESGLMYREVSPGRGGLCKS